MAATRMPQPGEYKSDEPWLIFEVKDVLYALNCAKIQSIMEMPKSQCFVALPDAPEYVRGMVRIRDKVVPTLDLRKLYGMTSVAEEYRAFCDMVDARKQDHVQWVTELENSVATGAEFTLARDPHKCAFGKWYYGQNVQNHSIGFVMGKIEEPHRKFHEVADETVACAQDHENCEREECQKIVLARAKGLMMPQILELLDALKESFRKQYQEKLIVLEAGDKRLAIIVDDVKAIDQLTVVDGQEEFSQMVQNQYIASVGKGQKMTEIILMLRADCLLELVQFGQEAAADMN